MVQTDFFSSSAGETVGRAVARVRKRVMRVREDNCIFVVGG